jgi:hypothetical protein
MHLSCFIVILFSRWGGQLDRAAPEHVRWCARGIYIYIYVYVYIYIYIYIYISNFKRNGNIIHININDYEGTYHVGDDGAKEWNKWP